MTDTDPSGEKELYYDRFCFTYIHIYIYKYILLCFLSFEELKQIIKRTSQNEVKVMGSPFGISCEITYLGREYKPD